MSKLLSLGNEAGEPRPDDVEIVGFANSVEIGQDGWALIPFGDWPHAQGLQHFTNESAQKIVDAFRGLWGRIKRAVVGLPIFNGHPDIPAFANDYPDKREYGQIADMEVRENGLALRPVISNAGADLIERGKKFISPHWRAKKIGQTAAGVPIFEPVLLASIGLTAKPNIPCPSLVNSVASTGTGTKTKENTVNKEALIALLGLANEATEQDITAAIEGLKKRPEETALTNEKTARTAAEGAKTALETEKKATETKLAEAQTALANERKARIEESLDRAIRLGRIAQAERATWQGRLEKDFANESQVLEKTAPKLKTKSEVEDVVSKFRAQLEKEMANAEKSAEPDGDEMTPAQRGMKIREMCNAEMAKLGNITNQHTRYNTAFANVKRAHPELFPELKTAAS